MARKANNVKVSNSKTSNAVKDPSNWTTGEEPMTGAQASYLKTLSEEAGKEMDDTLTKGEASEQIDALRTKDHVVENRAADPQHASNAEKDPSTWTTGKEPMTGAQASYLKTLSEEAGEEVEADLTKAEASMKIDELRQGNPRAKQAKPAAK